MPPPGGPPFLLLGYLGGCEGAAEEAGHQKVSRLRFEATPNQTMGPEEAVRFSGDYHTDWDAFSEAEGTGTATLGDHFKNR